MTNEWNPPSPQDEGDPGIEWEAIVWLGVTLTLFIYAGLAQKPLLALLSLPIGLTAGLLTAAIVGRHGDK